MGLAVGDPRIAHHMIPWELGSNELVQKAAGSGFHLDEILNGIPITTLQHNPPHAAYNNILRRKLLDLYNSSGGSNLTALQAEVILKNLTSQIRNWIIAHPTQSINNIILP